MSSDRARVSYDPTREYRSVVAQQGRVTLEADVNEAQEIAGETSRVETIDVIGPSGTPDDGYAIAAVPGDTTLDFAVGAGTMYVGGERVTLPPPGVKYSTQTEWLDRVGDPLWPVALQGQNAPPAASEFVYLFLREQEVGAIEDGALREVALGGADTAQRKRLIQRIVRMAVTADKCATALQAAQAAWSDAGVTFDPKTMMLNSPATLQVGLVDQPTQGTVCDPQAQGGYIGADNQLIRVQISYCDPNKSRGRLVWSLNNASFLHRLKPVDQNLPSTLQLMTTPVDTDHAPRAGHPVEILRSAVLLSEDPSIDRTNRDYVAAHTGVFSTPAQDYDADFQRLVLPAALPAEYIGGTAPLFLRLWEEELPFTSGQAVTLTGTGLQVVIDLHNSGGSLTVGRYWTFAARPITPAEVYPHRYLFAPQPPEGSRMWACPLATIGWQQQTFALLEDCRNPFDNLVELTKRQDGCCGVVVKPADVGGGAGLQDLIDKLAGQKATVSLLPGLYELTQPLTLSEKHSDLTLEGCHDGAVLAAKPGYESHFMSGLVQVLRANEVTLRRLRFHLPLARPAPPPRVAIALPAGILGTQAAARTASASVAATRATATVPVPPRGSTLGAAVSLPAPQPVLPNVPAFATSIGVLAVDCADLRIEECLFRFRLTTDVEMYAAGVLAASECWNLTIERNRFLHDDQYDRPASPRRFMVGILATTTFPPPQPSRATRKVAANTTNGVPVLLENTRIVRNEFGGLTMAVYARARLARVFCDDNVAHGCDGGFYFVATDLTFLRESLLQAYRPSFVGKPAEQKAFLGALQATQSLLQVAMYDFGIRVPLPTTYAPAYTFSIGKAPAAAAAKALTAWAKRGYTQLLATFPRDPTQTKGNLNLTERQQSPPPGAAGAAATNGAPAAPAPPKFDSSTIKTALTSFLAAAPAEHTDHAVAALRFVGNDVEILPVTNDQPPRDLTSIQPVALLVALAPGVDASIATSANNLRGNSRWGALAIIQFPTVATVTGNMVLNAAGEKFQGSSLWLQADPTTPLMNVSGNAFRSARTIVPTKPSDAGCGATTWDALNSTRAS
jgi:hypothetical protein